jgi:ribosome biogenesis protein Nip4
MYIRYERNLEGRFSRWERKEIYIPQREDYPFLFSINE